MSEVLTKCKKAKEISRFLNDLSTNKKNEALLAIQNSLTANEELIILENYKDLLEAKKAGMSESLQDRLAINKARLKAMVDSLKIIIDLADPIGEIIEGWQRPNGLVITKKRVPIGVIAIIYEARPNVTIDAVGLTLKSSNAVVLRGSSSAINSNRALVGVINEALQKIGFPKDTVQLIEDTDRESIKKLVTMNGLIDLVIPRGGAGLIKTVVETATVPCIETGVGNCHIYIDKDAKLEYIIPIVLNSKVQRPSVCNATESLVIHKDIAEKVLPDIINALKEHKVELYGCEVTQQYDQDIKLAKDEDYAMEFLDLKISIIIVDSIDKAIEHITKFGTKHTEAIISENYTTIEKFKNLIDAAAIMVNTSTRFTDGFEFGFGAEMGISTQKMHARGPMGLKELTTYKYIVSGTGQIRS